MNACEFSLSITALANTIAQNSCSDEELALLAAAFSQLGDTLSTILSHRELCEK